MSNKTNKGVVKQLGTTSNISDVLVYDSGSDEMKRVSKTDFDALYETSSTNNGPKKYVATLTQSGTNAPVAVVLENTLGGTLVWSYDTVGNYLATLTGAFSDASKVVIRSIIGSTALASGSREYYIAGINDADSIYLANAYINNSTGALTASNGVMYDETPIEIIVYP